MTFKKLLFVCMGNSCSSPMAETIMQSLMVKTSLYWEVDSAALRAWNIGRKPHKSCLRVLREHGLRSDHFCRLLTVQDFYYFDYIIAMNEHTYKELLIWADANRIPDSSQVLVLSTFGKNGKGSAIPNLSPGTKMKAFRSAYYQIKDCCKQLILGQEVSIVRYDLPSTEDSEDGNALQGTIEQSTSETPESVNTVAHKFPANEPTSTPFMSCSVCSLRLPNSNRKTLCQKCGQKFLDEL